MRYLSLIGGILLLAVTSSYGHSIGTQVDSTNIGITTPVAYYSLTPLRLTAQGGNFTGGTVRISVQYMAFRGPWAW